MLQVEAVGITLQEIAVDPIQIDQVIATPTHVLVVDIILVIEIINPRLVLRGPILQVLE